MLDVMYFYSNNSGPCKLQNALIMNLEGMFKKSVKFSKINIDDDKETPKKYNVNELPTIVIENDGEEKERFTGLTQELFLKKAIEMNLKD